jgi:hypothetical protein
MEGRVVTKKFTVDFKHEMMEHPAALARFFREKDSETVVLAEGAELHLLPVSQSSFLAVQWYHYKEETFIEVELTENRETFYRNVIDLYSKCLSDAPNKLTDDKVRKLPVVQQICNRFFS